MASRSSTPQSGPKAQAVSYSGPSPCPVNSGLVTLVARPQLMVQEKHALGRTSSLLARDSPPTRSAVAKEDSRKFLVGRPQFSLRMLMRISVPYNRRAEPPTGCALSLSLALTTALRNTFESGTR